MNTTILLTVLSIFLFVLYAMCAISGRASEREELMTINEWRQGLERKDLVRYCSGVWVIDSIENDVLEIRNNNETIYVLRTDCWPVN